jgi:hypothetical protein
LDLGLDFGPISGFFAAITGKVLISLDLAW